MCVFVDKYGGVCVYVYLYTCNVSLYVYVFMCYIYTIMHVITVVYTQYMHTYMYFIILHCVQFNTICLFLLLHTPLTILSDE